jgi:hypothetical protein
MIICHGILVRRETVQTKVVEKVKNTLYGQYIFYENCAVNEMMWKNMVQPDG